MASARPEIKVPLGGGGGRDILRPSRSPTEPWEAAGKGEKGRLAQRETELPWKSLAEI